MLRMRGGEKVLEQLCKLFPTADITCLVFNRDQLSEPIQRHSIKGSVFQKVAAGRNFYRELLPFHPWAISQLRVPDQTRMVVCSDAAMIKGIKVSDESLLICYCHSPPRYLWEMADTYASKDAGMGWLKRMAFRFVIPYCQRFDFKAAQRVDLFVANSSFVAERIKKFYNADSVTVYPPVAVDDFDHQRQRRDFFLIVSELVPYKRIDIAVQAFNNNGLPLVIIGDGPEKDCLRTMAKDNIIFLGRQPFDVLREHYETCRAFVFPGLEDFGITPLEAQAAGAPVVAFGEGGALETVVSGETGLFFESQTVKSLCDAIGEIDNLYGSKSDIAFACRANAERFGPERFRYEMAAAISEFLDARSIEYDLFDSETLSKN
jgi:glycosyltransferase involved in cell wall biosynthesis